MDDGGFFFFICLLSVVICGGLGFAIGNAKGIAGMGAALGICLGPIGLLITAIMQGDSSSKVNEPDYYAPAPGVPRAVVYPSMDGPALPRVVKPKIARPNAPRFFVCAIGGEVRGPYTNFEISQLRNEGEIDDTTLFCAEGSQDWVSAAKSH